MSKDNSSFLLETEELWRISAGGMELSIGKADGCVNRIVNLSGERKVWAAYCGDVTVRDDLLQRTFGRRDLKSVAFEANAERLVIHKQFQGAPWLGIRADACRRRLPFLRGQLESAVAAARLSGSFLGCERWNALSDFPLCGTFPGIWRSYKRNSDAAAFLLPDTR